MKLTMQMSPYLVEPSRNPQKAIEIALERDLLEKYKIDSQLIEKYLNSRDNIPIWIIEAACKINEKCTEIPIQYQNVWFCLNRARLVRKLPSKVIRPKLNFHTVYIEPTDKVISLIRKALGRVGSKTRLAELCGVKHRQTIQQWVRGKIRPQLMGFMKICDILGKDLWGVLDGHKMYGHSCPEEESFTFYNYPRRKLLDILTWIKLEGHIPLKSGAVETNQKKEDIIVLEKFSERMKKLYKMNPKLFFIYDNSTKKGTIKDWEGFKLHISSSPLRQILCLKYNIPLGYKCSFLNLANELGACKDREDFYRLLSTTTESEGSFTSRKENAYNRPVINLTSLSYRMIEDMVENTRRVGYNVYFVNNRAKTAYDLKIQGLDSFVKCCFDTFPYFSHPSKLKRAIDYLLDEKILLKIWIKSSPKIKRLIKIARDKYPAHINNKKLAKEIMKITSKKLKEDFRVNRHTVNGWLNSDKSLPLLAVILLSNISNKNYFNHIQKYFGLVLWIHGFIKREELETLRNIPNSFKHIEEAMNNGL